MFLERYVLEVLLFFIFVYRIRMDVGRSWRSENRINRRFTKEK